MVAGGGAALSCDGNGGGGGQFAVVVVADQEYNTRKIVRAAMGAWLVVDMTVVTPNRYSCLLTPLCGNNSSGAGSNLISGEGKFVCVEYVQQIVSKARLNNSRDNPNLMALTVSPLLVKEIKTISIYDVDGEDWITCRQRTATHLVPSQTNPIAIKRWQLRLGPSAPKKKMKVEYQTLHMSKVS